MNNTKRENTTAADVTKSLNPCPNAGSASIDEATKKGIEQMCNNVSETIFARLQKLFTAAVRASQCADNESELTGVRNMLEWQLSDLFGSLEKDCNMQMSLHVCGSNPFADVQPEILI